MKAETVQRTTLSRAQPLKVCGRMVNVSYALFWLRVELFRQRVNYYVLIHN